MSSAHNPSPLIPIERPTGDPIEPGVPVAVENPRWSGWDVLALAILAVLMIVLSLLAVSVTAHRYLYARVPWAEVAQRPDLVVLSQLLAYVIVLGVMYQLAGDTSRAQVARSIRWNWPRNWGLFLVCGVALSLGLQFFARVLPMPKRLPLDAFFQTPWQAWLLSLFGISFAPLLEELFFRGFLYPVLARWLKVPAAVVLTAMAFALLHGFQLAFSWGPVLIIFLVGLTLTAVRAYKKSVASTVLMHIAYNATISAALFFSTDGFRHLERLHQ